MDERSAQVSLMYAIYHYAVQVVVWLGEGSDNNEEIMKAILALNYLHSVGDFQSFRREHWPWSLQAAWSAFSQRPYWERLWIIQELYFARSLSVHCGEYTVSWESLQNFIIHSPYPDVFNGVLGVSLLIGRRNTMIMLSGIIRTRIVLDDLGKVLNLGQHFKCSDPRDRIFGLAGLFSARSGSYVPLTDYSRSSLQLYAYIMRCYIYEPQHDNPEVLFIGTDGSIHYVPLVLVFSKLLQAALNDPFSADNSIPGSESDARLQPNAIKDIGPVMIEWRAGDKTQNERCFWSPAPLPDIRIRDLPGAAWAVNKFAAFVAGTENPECVRAIQEAPPISSSRPLVVLNPKTSESPMTREVLRFRPFFTNKGEFFLGPASIEAEDIVGDIRLEACSSSFSPKDGFPGDILAPMIYRRRKIGVEVGFHIIGVAIPRDRYGRILDF